MRAAAAVAPVGGLAPVRRVALAEEFGCVLTRDARALCAQRPVAPWEENLPARWYELSFGDAHAHPVDLAVTADRRSTVGQWCVFDNACVVMDTGEVWCWGPGPHPEVMRPLEAVRRANGTYLFHWKTNAPDAPSVSPHPPYGEARRVEGLRDVVQVGLAETHFCAVTARGNVRCWGTDAFGQLGDGEIVRDQAAPTGPSWVVRDERWSQGL